MPRHAVIPSRVLIVISTVVVALVLLLASSVEATSDEVSGSPSSPGGGSSVAVSVELAEYEVRAGDSLWRIADEHTSPGHDVRNTIEAIKRRNGLDSSVIRPGQVLEIPLRSAD